MEIKRQSLQHHVLGAITSQFERADTATKAKMLNQLLDFAPEDFLLGMELMLCIQGPPPQKAREE